MDRINYVNAATNNNLGLTLGASFQRTRKGNIIARFVCIECADTIVAPAGAIGYCGCCHTMQDAPMPTEEDLLVMRAMVADVTQ